MNSTRAPSKAGKRTAGKQVTPTKSSKKSNSGDAGTSANHARQPSRTAAAPGRHNRGRVSVASSFLIGPPAVNPEYQQEEDFTMGLVVVFSLEQTLAHYQDGKVIKRPYASKLLKLLKDNQIEMVVWSSATQDAMNALQKTLDPKSNIFDHTVARDSSWYNDQMKNGQAGVKDLRRLGRPLENTLVIDHIPVAVRLNPQNAILLEDYWGTSQEDASLEILSSILLPLHACLLQKKCDVVEFMRVCPVLHYRSFQSNTFFSLQQEGMGASDLSGSVLGQPDNGPSHTPASTPEYASRALTIPAANQLPRPGSLEGFALKYIAPEKDDVPPSVRYQRFGGQWYKLQYELM